MSQVPNFLYHRRPAGACGAPADVEKEMNTLFMHCRPGFEGEVCAEISEHAAHLGIAGYAKGKPQSACAEFVCAEAEVPNG